MDISKKEDIYKMVAKTVDGFGKINLLVNNAAIVIEKPFLETEKKLWDKTIDINLKETYFCFQAAVKAMYNKNGGRIIKLHQFNQKQAGFFLIF